MVLGTGFIFIGIFLVTWFEHVFGDTCYVASFKEDVKSCPDFKNELVDAEGLKLGLVEGNEDEEGGLGLSGYIELFKDLDDGLEISISVSKESALGNEPVITMAADFCSSLGDEDAPWYPIVASLNATECPVASNKYIIDKMVLNLDYAKDVLTYDWVGGYECLFELKEGVDTVVCFLIGLAISEKEC